MRCLKRGDAGVSLFIFPLSIFSKEQLGEKGKSVWDEEGIKRKNLWINFRISSSFVGIVSGKSGREPGNDWEFHIKPKARRGKRSSAGVKLWGRMKWMWGEFLEGESEEMRMTRRKKVKIRGGGGDLPILTELTPFDWSRSNWELRARAVRAFSVHADALGSPLNSYLHNSL